ncbi:MAG TPA: competence/damage-inducible protein A [Candidatus Acidoferrales bacterium]|jgi:nicotinamide-nucleotide amidase|nr:competence/damage-inducible protein A [Candidatus Acidoferrales bacterium]
MKAEIIAVGSELLTPDRVDTNSLFLTAQLNRLGIEVTRKTVVGDELAALRNAFDEAAKRVELVIASGGLGPTEDDRTRDAVADLFGRKLTLDPAVMGKIEARFRQLGRKMSEVNARQAMVPEGAAVLENDRGTAPGLWLEAGGRIVILLPGPPHELKAMFAAQVESRLARLATGVRLVAHELRVAGMGESDVDQRIAPIYTRHDDVQTTILTAPGEIQIHLRMWSNDTSAAERQLQGIQESIVLALGEAVFTTAGESMEEVVAQELTMHHATIATAESCTGGLLAERLTRISGSSAYFLGGVVSYSNALKSAWVDVPAEIIESRGAVSSEVAVALADGIRRRTGATLGVGITGVAGPTGGTPEKPVGTVHVAIADASGSKERGVRYPGERDRIRWQASQTALDLVRRYFLYASQPKSGG